MRLNIKNIIIFVETILLVGLLFLLLSKNSNGISEKSPINTSIQSEVVNSENNLDDFPILELPSKYFDKGEGSLNIGDGPYSTIHNEQFYRSYPYTNTLINTEIYSDEKRPLPPIKEDDQIFAKELEHDFGGTSKQESIDKFGDIARRFAGDPGVGISVYEVKKFDVNGDGQNEQIVSVLELGANIIGQWDVIINNKDEIIFSTDKQSFSSITPSDSGIGFYLTWDDNFKGRDGHMITRFIFEDDKYLPIYEQQIRFIRIKDN